MENTIPPTRHITRVRIENFQDHRDTDVRFEPGINLITGSSDAGKSAILRAINFVLHNRPRGNSFVRHGTPEARVTLWYSDGTIIQRIKGDSNAVVVQKPNQEAHRYERFGNELPAEVLEALGHPPADEKHGPLSYAEQMAPLFLVALSPTELPKSIAELTGIEAFQMAADALGKRHKSAGRQANEVAERIARYEEQLQAYTGLDAELEALARQEELAETIQALRTGISAGAALRERYRDVVRLGKAEKEARDKAEQTACHAGRLPEMQALCEAITQGRALWEQHADTEAQLRREAEKQAQAAQVASALRRTQLAQAQQVYGLLTALRAFQTEFQAWLAEGRTLRTERDDWLRTLQERREEHARFVIEMKAAGMWCEACERPLTTERKEHACG